MTVTLVIGGKTLADKSLELAQKLDLHRLSGHAKLAAMATLPMVEGTHLLAIVETDRETMRLAALDPADSAPNVSWGLGEAKPLVYGIIPPAPPHLQSIDPNRLIELSSGNARLVRLRNELDGRAAEFGAKFWRTLESADPLSVSAVRQVGVSVAVYRDRYLLTPLNLKLLHEVMESLPGKSPSTRIEISTAQLRRNEQPGSQAYHAYADDKARQAVLEGLFPGSTVSILPKAKQPHARSLEMELNDGRRFQILLDQGFGAWRADGPVRHDFRDTPDRQAVKIKQADIQLRMNENNGAPVIMEFIQ